MSGKNILGATRITITFIMFITTTFDRSLVEKILYFLAFENDERARES